VKFDALPDLGFSDLPDGTAGEENAGESEGEETAVAPRAEEAVTPSGSTSADNGL
jgi:hypothetical protein